MKLLKFLLALALLPALGSSVHFGMGFLGDAVALKTWSWVKAACLGGGVGAWLLIYFTMPRPTRLYILGHELTHALAIWVSGGKIFGIKIKKTRGHVVSNKTSAWIALAPYIIPLYPLLGGLGWLLLVWLSPHAKTYEPIFLFLWGMLWGFHFSFTFSVMKTDQDDLASQGYLFSFTTIFLANWWTLLILLWSALGVYHFNEGWVKLGHIVAQDYARIGMGLLQGWKDVVAAAS